MKYMLLVKLKNKTFCGILLESKYLNHLQLILYCKNKSIGIINKKL